MSKTNVLIIYLFLAVIRARNCHQHTPPTFLWNQVNAVHSVQNCANTLPTVDISNSNSHNTCIQRITDVRCENLSAQHSAQQQHNVVTDDSKHFSDEPGKIVRDHEIHLKPGSRHSKQSSYRINTEKSSLAAPTSATVLLYHIVVCLLHILADLLKEIDRLEQQIAHNKRMF